MDFPNSYEMWPEDKRVVCPDGHALHGFITEEGEFIPVGPPIPLTIPKWLLMNLLYSNWIESFELAVLKN